MHAASAPAPSRHPTHTRKGRGCRESREPRAGSAGLPGERGAAGPLPGREGRAWRTPGADEGSARPRPPPCSRGRGRFTQKWGALSSGARAARMCSCCRLLPNVHPPQTRPGGGARSAPPDLGGRRRGWAAPRRMGGGPPSVRPSVRRGAGDTPAASAPRALVAGSVGRAVLGFRGPGRPLSGRKTHGKPPSPRAPRALRTSPGGAPERRACRRPRPERRPAPSHRRPGPPPRAGGAPTLPGPGDGRPGTRGAAVAGPRRGRQRPSPGECGGPRPVAPLRVRAAPPRSPAPRPRRSWAAPAGPPSWRPNGSRSSR